MKEVKEIIIDLLLSIVSIVCWLVSYGFCNGTAIGTAIAMILLTVTVVCVFLLGYRLNK